jgi:hypothetical protein
MVHFSTHSKGSSPHFVPPTTTTTTTTASLSFQISTRHVAERICFPLSDQHDLLTILGRLFVTQEHRYLAWVVKIQCNQNEARRGWLRVLLEPDTAWIDIDRLDKRYSPRQPPRDRILADTCESQVDGLGFLLSCRETRLLQLMSSSQIRSVLSVRADVYLFPEAATVALQVQ